MSAKVSSASSASAGTSIVGGKAAAAIGPAAGSAVPDGASGAATSHGASGCGASPRFSSAMSHAAHAGDSAAGTHIHDGTRAEADAAADGSDGSNSSAGANATVVASAHDLSANASPALSQNAANLKTCALGQTGNTRGGRSAIRIGSGEPSAGDDDASKLAADPVAVALLLVASGMPMGNAADSASAAADAGNARAADIGVSGAAADVGAGLSATDPASARDAAHSILDVARSSISAGAGLPGTPASLTSKSASPDSRAAPTSIMTDSAGLPELVRSFVASSAQTPVVEATISVPVVSGSWPQAVAAQVHWFVNNGVQSATLRLSPEHLGPVEVQIDVHDSQVNVNFSAAHAETRAALEQTVPRLREIFASGGLTLGQANVQQDPRPGSQSTAVSPRAAFVHAQTVEPVAVAAAHTLGLVDEYA
jgi:flagellar hook-length control protein FliK